MENVNAHSSLSRSGATEGKNGKRLGRTAISFRAVLSVEPGVKMENGT